MKGLLREHFLGEAEKHMVWARRRDRVEGERPSKYFFSPLRPCPFTAMEAVKGRDRLYSSIEGKLEATRDFYREMFKERGGEQDEVDGYLARLERRVEEEDSMGLGAGGCGVFGGGRGGLGIT